MDEVIEEVITPLTNNVLVGGGGKTLKINILQSLLDKSEIC